MNGSVHIDLSFVAATIAEWPGDRRLLARQAAYPDEVASLAVEGYGAHLFGRNLESLTHFCWMRDGKPQGWGLHLDPSLPHLDLSRKRALARPEAWPWPVDDVLRQNLPLAVLLRALEASHSTTEADELTFPSASNMAAWCEVVLMSLPKEWSAEQRGNAISTVAGWALHYVEDCCVPHHAGGMLLGGHAEFEAEQQQVWELLRRKNAPQLHRDPPRQAVVLRSLAERCAAESFVAKSVLCRRRWFWRKGWRAMMVDSLVRGLDAAIIALRQMATFYPKG